MLNQLILGTFAAGYLVILWGLLSAARWVHGKAEEQRLHNIELRREVMDARGRTPGFKNRQQELKL